MTKRVRGDFQVKFTVYAAIVLFSLLQAPALAAGTEGYHLYVARFSDGDITVIDSATHKEIGKITMGFGSNPAEIIQSPDKKLLYVSNRGLDELAVIDVKSGKVTARIKTGIHPNFTKMTTDGRYLVVANNQDNQATVIDLSTNAVAGKPAAGSGASGVAITDDSRYVYITSIYDDDISVIDLGNMERVRIVKVRGAMAIVIPHGSRFAYLCSNRNSISILDISVNEVVGSIPVGDTPNYITLSSDGVRAFVTNAMSNTLSVIDLAKRAVIKEIAVGREPTSSALSPDGKFLFVNNYSDGDTDGSISVIDVNSLTEIERFKFVRNPRALAVLPAK